MKEELLNIKDQFKQLEEKYKGAVARKKVVETEMKSLKDDFQSKIKVLLGKTENDDKLIAALKGEISKLRSGGNKPSKSEGNV